MQKIVFRHSLQRKRNRNNLSWYSNADIRELVKIIIVLGLAFSGVILLIIGYYWVKVDDIKCQTQRGRCTPEMISWLNSFDGSPAPWAMYKINNELQSEFKFVEETQSQILWPSSLKVETVIKTPALTITTRELSVVGIYYLVSFDGILMEKITNATDPILTLENIKTPLGQKLEQVNVNAIQIAYHMSLLGYKFQARTIDNNLYVKNENTTGSNAIWFDLEDLRTPAELVSSYQVIARQPNIANTSLTIDMRYNRPVIRDFEPAVAGDSTGAN